MKIGLLVLLPLCLGVSIVAVAQSPNESPRKHRATGPQSTFMLGTVSEQGGKLRLVTEQRIWKVDNPEILKGHEGHYVRVNAHVDPQKGLLHITEVNLPTAHENTENSEKSHTHRQVCLPLEWSQQAAAQTGWVCYSMGPTVRGDERAHGNTQ